MGFALTGAKADERHVLLSVLAADAALLRGRHHQVMIADKNYYGREFETTIGAAGVELLRPARTGEPPRPGARFFRPLRQTIESIFDTAKVSSTWKDTADTRSPASPCGSTSGFSP